MVTLLFNGGLTLTYLVAEGSEHFSKDFLLKSAPNTLFPDATLSFGVDGSMVLKI
ncbi:hypothetical protein AB9M62_41455 [Bacillales bacterium AN1005]|uniref:Uncharacterized protein n=1 Tax=Paenibacillus illinoisensis TaxID=59845 RepID=A0ABW8HR65_9BACL|nr:hypothetical protein MT997_22790 [Paenibacillus sp. OVF10]